MFVHRRSEWRGRQANADVLHEASDLRTREGVPLQPVSDPPQTNRGGTPAESDRAPDQDLVPEQAHEMEERLPFGARCRQGRATAATDYVTSGAAPPSSAGAEYSTADRARAPLSAAARHRTWRDVLLQ